MLVRRIEQGAMESTWRSQRSTTRNWMCVRAPNLSWRRRRPMAKSCVFVPWPELEKAEADGEEPRIRSPIRDGRGGGGRGVRGGDVGTGRRRRVHGRERRRRDEVADGLGRACTAAAERRHRRRGSWAAAAEPPHVRRGAWAAAEQSRLTTVAVFLPTGI
jgi:hypothetical protein